MEQTIGFRKSDLLATMKHYEELAERYKHIPETFAGYGGRVAMLRDLIWHPESLPRAEKDATPD